MNTREISFSVSLLDRRKIEEIADRAMGELRIARRNDPFTRLDIVMDVTAVHANGCPLRLGALEEADAFNFAHDILGIRTHLDRETGELMDCFRPRFSRHEAP